MNKKKVGIITASVLAAGLAVGGVTTGVVLSTRPLNVTYYANNGTAEVTTQIKQGDIDSLPTPTREGYNFAGWYLDTGLTKQVTAKTKLKQNSKLYAGWELANYELASTTSEVEPLAETTGLKSIGAYAFVNSKLTSVTIPDTVTTIGDCAFSECTELTKVTIPASITEIGSDAFSYCEKLVSVVFDNNCNITNLSNTFYKCSSLTSVNIPDSVTRLDGHVFSNCRLKSITLPNNLEYIDKGAFEYNALTEVIIPDSCYEIAPEAFLEQIDNNGNPTLKKVIFGKNITSINENAFRHNPNITTISTGGLHLSNYEYAFDSSDLNLKEIIFQVHPTSSPFYLDVISKSNCSNVDTLHFNFNKISKVDIDEINKSINNAKNIFINGTFYEDGVFKENKVLENLYIQENCLDIMGDCFLNCSNLKKVEFAKNSTTTIHASAFSGCENLTTLTLPESLGGIKEYAFSGTNLSEIIIPDSVTAIGEYAFEVAAINPTNCLTTKIQLGKNLQEIGSGAFQDRINITSFGFGSNLISVADDAFSFSGSNLTELSVGGEKEYWGIFNSLYNIIEEINSLETLKFNYGGDINTNSLSNGLYGAKNLYFYGNPDPGKTLDVYKGDNGYDGTEERTLQYVYFGEGCTELRCLFRYNNNLTTIEFADNSVEAIGSDVFKGCDLLRNVKLPSSLKSIGERAFFETGIRELIIPQNVEVIDSNIIGSLTSFGFDGAINEDSINANFISDETANSLTSISIGDSALLNNAKFANKLLYDGRDAYKKVTYKFDVDKNFIGNVPKCLSNPSEVVVYGNIADNTFEGNTNIEIIHVKAGCTYIGEKAFRDCTNLREIYFEDGIDLTIAQNAFEGCGKIDTLYYNAKNAHLKDIIINDVGDLHAMNGYHLFQVAREQGQPRIYMNVTIGKDVEVIPSGIFYAAAIRTLFFEETTKLKEIADGAFCIARGFTSVEIPESVKYIGEQTFASTSVFNIAFRHKQFDFTIGKGAFTNMYIKESPQDGYRHISLSNELYNQHGNMPKNIYNELELDENNETMHVKYHNLHDVIGKCNTDYGTYFISLDRQGGNFSASENWFEDGHARNATSIDVESVVFRTGYSELHDNQSRITINLTFDKPFVNKNISEIEHSIKSNYYLPNVTGNAMELIDVSYNENSYGCKLKLRFYVGFGNAWGTKTVDDDYNGLSIKYIDNDYHLYIDEVIVS